jgi:hydrophobic/amphiphilic exporter-1 (mainly G- bacteria), HAE1 family
MRIAALVLLGAICLIRLPIDLLPKVSIPTVVVSTSWPNVAPEEMETTITRPLEQAVSSATNLLEVDSTTTQGQSSVRIQFNWGTDIGQAAVEVLQLVQRARTNFPSDPTLGQPLVFKYDPSTLPIMVFSVSGESDAIKLRTVLDNNISPIIESANGVAAATVTGGQQRAIMIDVDPIKLQAYGIPLQQVSSRIVAENINLPAGIAKQGNTEYTIRSVGYLNSPAEAADIPVGVYKNSIVTLGMVAKVSDSHQETRIITRLNGKQSAGLIITKQTDANTVSTAQNVLEKIKQANKLYPNLKFDLVYDQAGFIQNSIDDLKNTAIIGGLLAILILMMFLRNFRSTMVVALSIPISIVSTFALLYFCGFTLNTISLSGLALATGLIVDDAVVVLENIFRHIERYKRSATDAAISGTTEILSAVIASTLTVMIVFLPLFMIKGQSGQTYTQFALVVIFSIAVSLLDATTVVPMLASRLIKEEEVEEEAHPELRAQRGKKTGPVTRIFDWFGDKFNKMDASYHKGLSWALHHRLMVLGGAVGITGASFLLLPLIGSEMLPATDSGNFTVNLKLRVGSAFSSTNDTMKVVEQHLLSNPDIEAVFTASGSNLSIRGTSTTAIGYQAGAIVRLKDNRKHSTQEVIKSVQKDLGRLPGIRALVTPYDLVTQVLTGGASNMEVDVFGNDQVQVMAKAKEVMEKLRQIPGLQSVDLGVQDATPEIQWKVDRKKAQELGVSFTDIANALTTATSGTLSSYYQEKGFQYPIYVQVPESSRKTVPELLSLPLTPSAKGGTTPNKAILLGQVATPIETVGPNQLTRIDRRRFIAVTGRVQERPDSEVQADIQSTLDKMDFPSGMTWQFGLAQQRNKDEFSGLGSAIFLAVALIYMLLASQFESFIYPLVVLTSVPLCALGVLLALFISGKAFGLTAFIGLLMLIGIVVKNGILLVDYTTQLRGKGMPRDEAILLASPTRLRPILMTSCAAVLGMLPLALGLGKGSETQQPLAIAVVGGLTTSTMLTLFIVPIVYTLFDDLARRLRKDPRDLYPPTPIEPNVTNTDTSFTDPGRAPTEVKHNG